MFYSFARVSVTVDEVERIVFDKSPQERGHRRTCTYRPLRRSC